MLRKSIYLDIVENLINMKRESQESSDKDEIPEFFLDKEEKNDQSKEKVSSSASSVKKKLLFKKPSGLLNKQHKDQLSKKEGGSLVDADYNRNKLFSDGINLMADEKLEDASHVFQMVLRINPNDVDALLKLGYARFHLEDYSESMRAYDKILDIDVTNADAWNLKSLVYYERKSYGRALDCADKAIDSDPTFGLAWYYRSCYLSMLNQVPESLMHLYAQLKLMLKMQNEL